MKDCSMRTKCAAVCCSVLQHVQSVAVCCSVLQFVTNTVCMIDVNVMAHLCAWITHSCIENGCVRCRISNFKQVRVTGHIHLHARHVVWHFNIGYLCVTRHMHPHIMRLTWLTHMSAFTCLHVWRDTHSCVRHVRVTWLFYTWNKTRS